MPSDPSGKTRPREHRLVDGSLKIEEHGMIGRCTCGWTTGHRISSMAASAAMQDHRESPDAR